MKKRLALLCVLLLGICGIAVPMAQAISVSVAVGDQPYYVHGPGYWYGHAYYVWVPGHWRWYHHQRVWIHGHYRVR
jgi:hypothetical protein